MRYPFQLFFLFACSVSATAYGRTTAVSGVDTSTYVILSYDKAFDFWMFDKSDNPKPTGLSRAEVNSIETLVDSAYQRLCRNSPGDKYSSPKPLSLYKRQYVAITNGNGQKEVWVNFFCNAPNGWRKHLIIVDDGGACYLRLRINLTLRRAYDLVPNGVA